MDIDAILCRFATDLIYEMFNMMRRELVYEILRLALSENGCNDQAWDGIAPHEWEWAFSVLSMHGLGAFAYSAVEQLPQQARPPKDVLLKFISSNMSAQQSYMKLKRLSEKIGAELSSAGIKCLLLKGLSLAEYYRRPEARKFLDIDMYAPEASHEIDKIFVAKGVHVDSEFYRHSHMSLSGVLVENHHCLLDVRGRKRLAELDADLKQMAISHLEKCDGPGLYYPDARFSLIFNLHHAMSHFIYEGISFKFLIDWIYFLEAEKELLSTPQTAQSLREHGLLKFAAVMTQVCVSHLGLKLAVVPQCVKDEMTRVDARVVGRFIDDLFRPYEQSHYKSIYSERIHNVMRIIRAAWKPQEFLGQSAVGFVWDKVLPILKGKKFEAD